MNSRVIILANLVLRTATDYRNIAIDVGDPAYAVDAQQLEELAVSILLGMDAETIFSKIQAVDESIRLDVFASTSTSLWKEVGVRWT